MIIKGKSRAGPGALAAHLGNAEKNERVTLLETRGTVSQDLRGALVEMDAYAVGTRCQKSLYHAAISPALPHRLSPEQRAEAIDALEERLGLTGHARVVVMHEKLGRQHIHVVWSRIDLNTMKSVSDSHNYRKHEEVARDLERRFGHERVQGAHHERDGVERPDRTPSRAELRQEERTGIKGRDVKGDVTAAFRASDNAHAFQAALEHKGYVLAQGDRRDFVIVDRAGGIHSLARRIDGMKAGTLREFMKPISREGLPTSERAREIAKELQLKLASRAEAKREAAYSRSEDYVAQTQAALKDYRARQQKLDAKARPDPAWQRVERAEKQREKAPAPNSLAKPLEDARSVQAAKMPEQTPATNLSAQPKEDVRTATSEKKPEQLPKANSQVKARDNVRSTQVEKERERPAVKSPTKSKDDERFAWALADHDPNRQRKGQARSPTKSKDDERIERLLADHDRDRRRERQASETQGRGNRKAEINTGDIEMTERQMQRLQRLRNEEGAATNTRDVDKPDRQREAPGGGRSRGR